MFKPLDHVKKLIFLVSWLEKFNGFVKDSKVSVDNCFDQPIVSISVFEYLLFGKDLSAWNISQQKFYDNSMSLALNLEPESGIWSLSDGLIESS